MAEADRSRTNIFLDSDVILDFLFEREPFYTPAKQVFIASKYDYALHTSSLAFMNVAYMFGRAYQKQTTMKYLRVLRGSIEVLPIGAREIDEAIRGTQPDFEDRVQMECALNHSMDYLLTRNIKHYPKKPNFIMTPEVFLTTL